MWEVLLAVEKDGISRTVSIEGPTRSGVTRFIEHFTTLAWYAGCARRGEGGRTVVTVGRGTLPRTLSMVEDGGRRI